MRPRHVFNTLETLLKSSTGPLYRKGVRLSANDDRTVKEVYLQWLLLMVDLGYLHSDELLRPAHRLWADMTRVDVYDLLSSCAECLQSVRMQNNKGFKALCSHISSHLYIIVKDDMERVCKANVFAAKRLIQLFSYMGRLSLNDIDLTQQLLEGYLGIEELIKPVSRTPLVQSLNQILKDWLGSFVPGDLNPKHGPGGVAGHGRCSLETKYKDLTSDQLLEYAFGKSDWIVGPFRSSMDRMSQTIFVPKSYKTFRTISMEPSTLQYFQQGVWRLIDDQVFRDSYLRNRIGFHDQVRNQVLAREGSLMRNFATIDLSSASDSVSYGLVKELFRGTWLYRFLIATRSRSTILPDGHVVALKKFAPMGSALCFPIETLIFAAICEHVTRSHCFPGKYSVFGDDIIVPTETVETMMRALSNLGFYVNNEKSYYHSDCWFRESCGGEYCDGFDVTPLRVSRRYASKERDVQLAGLISMANNAFQKEYHNLRYFYIYKLQMLKLKPLFSPDSIMSDSYSNYHLDKRWNHHLQRIEVRASRTYSKAETVELEKQDEEIRYRHWHESVAGRTSLGDGFQSVTCKRTVGIKDTWCEKCYEELDQLFIDDHTMRGLKPPSTKSKVGKV